MFLQFLKRAVGKGNALKYFKALRRKENNVSGMIILSRISKIKPREDIGGTLLVASPMCVHTCTHVWSHFKKLVETLIWKRSLCWCKILKFMYSKHLQKVHRNMYYEKTVCAFQNCFGTKINLSIKSISPWTVLSIFYIFSNKLWTRSQQSILKTVVRNYSHLPRLNMQWF